MNMNKYFSFAIVVFLMAVPLVLTSCGKDNILDDVEELSAGVESMDGALSC